jgi:glycosyltransferase involved in cell wall biosynthesis
MRLLMCTDTYPPQLNGVSVITALTVAGLRERGWECTVVAPAYPRHERTALAVPEHVPVIPLRSVAWPPYPELRLALATPSRLRPIVEQVRPDVVHSATEFLIGRSGKVAAQTAGIPWCSSYHTDFVRYTASYGLPWLRRAVATWIARFHADAARVFTPSSASRDDLRQLGVRDVERWGRSIDHALFHPSHRSATMRERLGLGDAFTFLHVGRLAPEKNVELLLDAFRLLQQAYPAGAVRLLVAGSGPSEASLRARGGPHVHFLGAVDRVQMLPALYASCDAFVYASATETLGLVVLEAMASGLPVVATPAGGVADYLEDSGNGLAYPAGDVHACRVAMQRLLDDASLRARLQAGARRTAESRSWSRELDRLDASYHEVIAGYATQARPGGAVPSLAVASLPGTDDAPVDVEESIEDGLPTVLRLREAPRPLPQCGQVRLQKRHGLLGH